jgi:hypothetical protein
VTLYAVEVRFKGRVRLKRGRWPFAYDVQTAGGEMGTFLSGSEMEARELASALQRIPGVDWVKLTEEDDGPVSMAQIELIMPLDEAERWAMGHATGADAEAMGIRIRAAVFGR